jgi:hypothetical protein
MEQVPSGNFCVHGEKEICRRMQDCFMLKGFVHFWLALAGVARSGQVGHRPPTFSAYLY